jgi:hypothetical protein
MPAEEVRVGISDVYSVRYQHEVLDTGLRVISVYFASDPTIVIFHSMVI